MPGLNKGLAPDFVLSGLDRVFFSAFNQTPGPEYADVSDDMVFKQDNTDRGGVITEQMADAGMWEERQELEDVSEGTIYDGTKRTFTVANFAKSLMISKHYFDDDQYGTVKRMVKKMANKGLLTKRKKAFEIYRNAFTTTLTNSGTALISDSHTTLSGATVDNKLTAPLSETSLDLALNMLIEQKDEAGDNVGHEAYCLLVPNRLYSDAVKILEAELEPGSANNDPNVFSTKYGIYLKQTNWIGATNSGSDTAWFLLAKDHTVSRWKRQEIVTDIVDYKYDKKNRYEYKAEYREVYGAISFEGIVGSTGAGA